MVEQLLDECVRTDAEFRDQLAARNFPVASKTMGQPHRCKGSVVGFSHRTPRL